jgi:hypothetical protein
MVMYNDNFLVALHVLTTHTYMTILLVLTSHILYFDNLETITAVDPLSTPWCALYTSELIRNLYHED